MTGSRDITSTTISAAQAPEIHPVLFFKMEFDSANINLHSDLGTIVWGGDTYTGVGRLGNISTADEVSDLSSSQINLSLSGLPLDLAGVLFNEQYQGRLATLYLGYLNLTTRVLVDTPAILYKGLIDTADFSQDKTFGITLSVGNRFAAWDKPVIRRYNNATQQSRFPGDTGLQYIEQTSNKTIIWGSAT
ncbi:hypothetical protein P12x_005245 [Tundrisphaera lichenicola]|uniref:hypothetical protein n=1 Tax=Tundrisphaera lichenicola TaxID=2029860 RepID=UPI003EC02883